MKKAVILIYALIFSHVLLAQEPEKYIKEASTHLQNKNYQKAIQSLTMARKNVIGILSGELEKALPQTVGNWSISEVSEQDYGYGGGEEIRVNKVYTQPKDNEEATTAENTEGIGEGEPEMMMEPMDEPQLRVTITNNMMEAHEVMQAHSGSEGMGYQGGEPGQTYEAKRVKDYRALLRYNENEKYGSISIIVGGGFIRIQGNQIDDPSVLDKMAANIDFEKVKTVLGE